MERYLCIHGHFYQPPRENPWLEAVEIQDSAYPCHDWNERVSSECYSPNAASRILDAQGRIVQITNNYSCISFNFGPTLLSWMAENTPDTYARIQAADAESRARFAGHGSAIAQAYNHMIMPLANARDKRTQILWGVADFKKRFSREPEGMWLPETAVDLETLDLMAEAGIKYTILSPYQAGRSRVMGEKEWTDATGGKIDPTRAYRQTLPSGRTIVIFFYDGPISRAVAFERLLTSGERFAERLMGAFTEREGPQLAHIATDGETYGHHHRHGDMALAYAIRHIDSKSGVTLTNYGEFLERFPPTHEAEIVENTSWSCVHGVGRWTRDCGCNAGGREGWTQQWRGPLRDALDWLRDAVGPLYEKRAADLVRDPWVARDDYINVILDRSEASADAFIERNCPRALSAQQRIWLWELMELQRHAMLMYTSCGWFFDEISGIETVQVIAYAGRVIQLADFAFGKAAAGIEGEFLKRLELAKSNIPENQNGRVVYDKFVKPAMLDLPQVAAHYAISSIFENYDPQARVFCYEINVRDYKNFEAGRARLIMGHGDVVSSITGYSTHLGFAAAHWGDHNLNAGVREFQGADAYNSAVAEMSEIFGRGDLPSLIRAMDHNYGPASYTLKSLFRDAQRFALSRVLSGSVADAEQAYRQVFENHAPLLRFLADIGMPPPPAFAVAAEFVFNNIIREALQGEDMDLLRARTHLDQVKQQRVKLDADGLGFAFKANLDRLARDLQKDPENAQALRRLRQATTLLRDLPFEVDLWSVQNRVFELMREVYPEMRGQASIEPDPAAAEWVLTFKEIAANVGIGLEP